MTSTTIKAALALLLGASIAFAQDKPGPAPAADAKPVKKAVKATQPVDINSASKAQLKKLPGIDDAIADKIVAGRPFLTKAHLVTHNVIPMSHYVQIKDLIIARQKQ